MDAAYDAEPIRQHSRSLGHVPLIDTNPRRDKTLAEELRTEARRLKNPPFSLPSRFAGVRRVSGYRPVVSMASTDFAPISLPNRVSMTPSPTMRITATGHIRLFETMAI